jgi:hypothetical protein
MSFASSSMRDSPPTILSIAASTRRSRSGESRCNSAASSAVMLTGSGASRQMSPRSTRASVSSASGMRRNAAARPGRKRTPRSSPLSPGPTKSGRVIVPTAKAEPHVTSKMKSAHPSGSTR